MGYSRSITIKDWPAHADLDGFEVTTRRFTVGEVDEITGLENVQTIKGFAAALPRLSEILADCIEGWNLVERGKLVPLDAEHIATRDHALIDQLLAALMRKSVSPPAPLSRPSSDGERYPEASIPMEPLSPSQPSSPAPDES